MYHVQSVYLSASEISFCVVVGCAPSQKQVACIHLFTSVVQNIDFIYSSLRLDLFLRLSFAIFVRLYKLQDHV